MADKNENVTVLTPELRAQLAPEIKSLEDAAFAKGKDEGAKSERERIKAIEDQGAVIPGHEKLVAELKYDGKTTGAEAASQILAAEAKKKADRVKDIRADAPNPAPAAAPPTKEPDDKKKPDHDALAKEAREYQAKQAKEGVEISNVDAVKFVYERAGVPLK